MKLTGRLHRLPSQGIASRLFLSYVLVASVGVLTLFIGVSYLTPTFFGYSMGHMMGGTMMGQMSSMNTAMSESIAESVKEATTASLLVASAAAVLAAAAISFFTSQRIVAPVLRMAQASQRISQGHYAERVQTEGQDELAELGKAFNQMASSLEEVERRRLALIGDVAHELRTPLSTFEGYAEGLLDGVVQPSPETFALIHSEARRLRRLVDDLQELSRVEARQISLQLRPVEPRRLVEAATARLRPQFEDKHLSLAVVLPETLPAVQADEDRAIQVITNLLGNALRYTAAGGTVSLAVRAKRDEVEFAIKDTGIGIAAEHLPHVFERFYRADRSRSRSAGGSGIGLTIAKHLVEAQGGTITAKSDGPGKGAEFTFTLPISRLSTPARPAST